MKLESAAETARRMGYGEVAGGGGMNNWLRQEPCRPYAIPALAFLAGHRAPVSVAKIVGRLSRGQLERLACAFSGADPEAFERWLREVTE